jgi:hypothetical protein
MRFVMSVCSSVHLSVRPHGITRLPLDGFSWNLLFEYFSKNCQAISGLIKMRQEITGTLHQHLCAFTIVSRSVLLRMRNFSDKSCRESQNMHFMFNNFFFRKSCRLWDNVEKYGTIAQTTWEYNTAHAICRHTPILYNTYCFCTATMVTRTRLDVSTLPVLLFSNLCYSSALCGRTRICTSPFIFYLFLRFTVFKSSCKITTITEDDS